VGRLRAAKLIKLGSFCLETRSLSQNEKFGGPDGSVAQAVFDFEVEKDEENNRVAKKTMIWHVSCVLVNRVSEHAKGLISSLRRLRGRSLTHPFFSYPLITGPTPNPILGFNQRPRSTPRSRSFLSGR